MDTRDTSTLQPPMHQDLSVQQIFVYPPLCNSRHHCSNFFRWRDWQTLCVVWRTKLDGNLVPKGSFASMMSFPIRPITFAHPSYNGLELFKEFPTVIQLFWSWRNIWSRSMLIPHSICRHAIWLVHAWLCSDHLGVGSGPAFILFCAVAAAYAGTLSTNIRAPAATW